MPESVRDLGPENLDVQPRVVVYLDHTAKWSGGEIALLRTLEALDRRRVTPVVLVAEEGPFADRLREIEIETHVLPLSGKARDVRKDTLGGGALLRHAGAGAALFRYAFTVAQFARKRGASILHCNSLKSDLYGALAGRIAGIPVIWHIRDHIDPSYLPGPAVRVLRALVRWAPRYVLTNSESTLEKLFPDPVDRERQRKTRASVAYDGLADREFTTPAPILQKGWKHEVPRIAVVGRFVAWKGQHIFLEAASKLLQPGDNETGSIQAEFVLIGKALFGEEEYEAELKRLAEPLGEQVTFLGFRSDIPELLRSMDIFVHTSITPEPFGQVVIEAMAEGIPVIATDGGGVQEIVEDGISGWLTPMGDADALATALRTLLEDPVRAHNLACAGHTRVRAAFTAARTARTVESVYDDLETRGSVRRPGTLGVATTDSASRQFE